jgi:hypothetical protein
MNKTLAQFDVGGQTGQQKGFGLEDVNPLQTTNIAELLDRVIGALLVISIPIATIMVIVGAFQILTAAGNVEKVSTGKKTILYAALGLGVILIARVLIAVVKGVLGVRS